MVYPSSTGNTTNLSWVTLKPIRQHYFNDTKVFFFSIFFFKLQNGKESKYKAASSENLSNEKKYIIWNVNLVHVVCGL